MIKKFVIYFWVLFIMVPSVVFASENSVAKIGDKYYDSLEEAIEYVGDTDVIMLVSNVKLSDSLVIDRVVNLNLNGYNVMVPSLVFQVQGGIFNVIGNGTIKELAPYYGAILVKGSADSSSDNYSVVTVGKDVILEGWSGIFVDHVNNSAYGIVVNFAGKINAVNDKNGGSGVGIYINGNIKHQDHVMVVNVLDNAEIRSSGNGIYIAGSSNFNIGKAYIYGTETGVWIKSGTLNIDGATVVCDEEDKTPPLGYSNGINPSGVAIQIESNSDYAGNIKLNISSGTFKSKNSNVIYEYVGKKNGNSSIYSVSISGGKYLSEVG